MECATALQVENWWMHLPPEGSVLLFVLMHVCPRCERERRGGSRDRVRAWGTGGRLEKRLRDQGLRDSRNAAAAEAPPVDCIFASSSLTLRWSCPKCAAKTFFASP